MSRFRDLLHLSRAAWLRGDAAATWRSLDEAEALAGDDPALRAEVLAARSVALVRAERMAEARLVAEAATALAATVPGPSAGLRAAVAHATVSRNVVEPPEGWDAHGLAAALAELDRIAVAREPELLDAASRAITNGLVLRMDDAWRTLGAGPGPVHSRAWEWVGRALTLAHDLPDPGTVLRQAVDLAWHTGQWERGWEHARTHLDRETQRNELVAVLAKGATFAWEAGRDADARELGRRAVASSVAVDHPWVRVYAYLGGVIAAAAGGGSLAAALRAYAACTDRAGHASRRGRAWHAALVALDAGHPPDDVRAFLRRVVPGGLGPPRREALARLLLADAEDRPAGALPAPAWAHDSGSPGPGAPDADALLDTLDLPSLPATDQARALLALARRERLHGRDGAAAAHLVRARTILAAWPGRVSARVEREVGAVVGHLAATPAQRRVLDLLVEGWSNAAVAAALGLSERTVAVHVSALLRANRATSRTELVARELRRRALAGDGPPGTFGGRTHIRPP
ncbi:helix-turn-helix domain-containing protein [Antribacter gilvus]|uniref:helix-turn-helix domain-containing protein n=1 Tax=Antribacter gilvus TaxID=2304675 RepID=UPI001980B762|nr:helix-turn-helix transcriptional regulator [Antribacter gilvus]